MEIREASLLIYCVNITFQSLITHVILKAALCFLYLLFSISFVSVSTGYLVGTIRTLYYSIVKEGPGHCWLFLLPCLLIYKKLHGAEHKTLDIIYREAPKGFLQLFSALNPMPSQLRYMQYVARRNISPEWPPMERALSLDCLILRAIPSFDSDNGCRPLVRIFGWNLLGKNGSMANMHDFFYAKEEISAALSAGRWYMEFNLNNSIAFCDSILGWHHWGTLSCRRIVMW